MVPQFHILTHLLLILLYTTASLTFVTAEVSDEFVRPMDQIQLGLLEKKQKLSHFKVYWHDIASGPNPTSISVVPSPHTNSSNTTAFGLVNMIDNPLTLGPEPGSKLVGWAQGFYASTSQSEVDLLMAMNFAITVGKYNGSTVTILGRNPVFNKEREMPVIGGSGLFRFATGYAQLRTHWFSPVTKDAIVEYNIYVLHY